MVIEQRDQCARPGFRTNPNILRIPNRQGCGCPLTSKKKCSKFNLRKLLGIKDEKIRHKKITGKSAKCSDKHSGVSLAKDLTLQNLSKTKMILSPLRKTSLSGKKGISWTI